MSQHKVVQDKKLFVFGWDQPLMSFFLQVHDLSYEGPAEERVIVRLGVTAETEMYEVEHLVQAASEHGLQISHQMQVDLYGEKDDGR